MSYWKLINGICIVVQCSHMPICLMPSLSSMSSCTRGMSMWSLGP